MTFRDDASVVRRDPLAWLVLAVIVAFALLRRPDTWPTSTSGVLGVVAFLVVMYGLTWLVLYAMCFHGRARWRSARRRGESMRQSSVSAVFGKD